MDVKKVAYSISLHANNFLVLFRGQRGRDDERQVML